MAEFKTRFAIPSRSLSLERARVLDDESSKENVHGEGAHPRSSVYFNAFAYKQPVLYVGDLFPDSYRKGRPDKLKEEVEAIFVSESIERFDEV